ncbi:hypothetical protein SUGI_0167890 [Cryptomeria japonica]|nr:hypothetical protein SUGI_0167890 [Cryptomeria japonica]
MGGSSEPKTRPMFDKILFNEAREGVASDKSAKENLASSVENEIAFLSGIVGCTERAVCGRAVQLPIEISSQHSRHKWFQ